MRTNRTWAHPANIAGLTIRGTNIKQWDDYQVFLVAGIWLLFNVLDIITETFKAAGTIPSIHPSSGSPIVSFYL